MEQKVEEIYQESDAPDLFKITPSCQLQPERRTRKVGEPVRWENLSNTNTITVHLPPDQIFVDDPGSVTVPPGTTSDPLTIKSGVLIREYKFTLEGLTCPPPILAPRAGTINVET